LGGLYTSGGSIEWLREVIGGSNRLDQWPSYETLIGEAEGAPPGSLGVHFLPYLRMSNPPYADTKARGAFIGLNTDIKRGVLFRAVLEGISYEARLCLETLLAHQGLAPPQIYAIGGGTRNPLYMRIKASVLNQPITILKVAEAVTLGAAMLGGLSAGVYPDVISALANIHHDQTRVEPDAAEVELYHTCYRQVYQQLYQSLRPLHHKIHDLQQGISET